MKKIIFTAMLVMAAYSIDGVPVGDLSNGRTERVDLGGDIKSPVKGATTTTNFGGSMPAVAELQAP